MLSNLEAIRQRHEDVETLRHLATAVLQSRATPTNPHPRLQATETVLQNSRAAEQLTADLVNLAHHKTLQLSDVYQNPSQIQSGIPKCDDPLSAFYTRLRDLRDVHRSSPALVAVPTEADRDRSLISAAYQPTQFSGEEGNGRYLDLLSHYQAYLNVCNSNCSGKGVGAIKIEYYEYVRSYITDFSSIPISIRNARPYAQYLDALLQYLSSFAARAHPLDSVESYIEKARIDFITDIEKPLTQISEQCGAAEILLQELGAESIKEKLQSLGLKCGGRPLDRAQRLLQASRKCTYAPRVLIEKVIHFIVTKLLREEQMATAANVQKKLSLSYAELEAERVAEENITEGQLEAADGEDVETAAYNPKDVPLGWDGKPIPYWMYKLHGLNHEFNCEICGNSTYKGPRAFERHFTEAQHVNGLRRLGIGYSKAFMMITGISDALVLHRKIVQLGSEATFDEERETEFEDQEGNVMSRKTYQDLSRQGLL